ncbi:MAG: ABC transporter substrate-binding protein [Oscillospiraceae bacterium]
MKKLLTIILSLAIAATAFTACGAKPNDGALKIGLIQLAEHPSLDEIRTAFTEEINAGAKAQGISVEIDYQNGLGEPSTLNTICQKFVGDKVDLIVAIATPAAQSAAAAVMGTDIPVIFSAVTDPVAAQLVTDLSAPEGNITGTSDAIPVDKIFTLAKELTPNVKSFGIVYNMGEPNSVEVLADAKAYLEANNIQLSESGVTAGGEIQAAVQGLCDKCDAIFIPIDNMVALAMPTVAETAIKSKTPVYAAADSLVHDGALASVGVNYTNLGKETGKMALQALTGTAIKDIPVMVLNENNIVVNSETAKAIGVDVSKYAK